MRAVLIDLDGVLYVGDQLVPGAVAAVARLGELGVPYLFVTNTTSRPVSALAQKLAGFGLTVTAEKFWTPALAATQWLADQRITGPALLVPEPTREDLPPAVATGESPGAVVLGDLGERWDYATLNRAFRWLMADRSPPLLALGMTRYWRAPDGLRLDAGAFVRALEYASGRTAVVLGKPAAAFFSIALARLGTTAGNTIMIGDDIVGDVGGAQRAGLRGLLVRTGKFRAADLAGDVQPEAVLDSIAALPEWLESEAR